MPPLPTLDIHSTLAAGCAVADGAAAAALQAFGDSQLTVAEATDIADNALEHTVRAVLQAVQVGVGVLRERGDVRE